MTDTEALQKKPCPACGADVAWDPGKGTLTCPYCGTPMESPPAGEGAEVVEHDLGEALRSLPAEKSGWQEQKRSVKCQSCRAISVFDPERAAQRCDFCGSPAIAPYEDERDVVRPESVLPFQVSETRVRESIRQWYRSRWFAPNRLKKEAMTDTLKGIYLPYWTFDARADAQWTAESGYYYYERETVRTSEGKTESRQVRKVRWEPSSGRLQHFFDDDLVPGTVGTDGTLLKQIEPFPTRELQPYDPSFVRGWVVERYQVDLGQAAGRSQEQMDQELRSLCAAQVPGDTHRNLQVRARYSERTFKHVLLPVWLLAYTYGPRVFQVLLNGYTGKIAGRHPYSWVKITLAVLAVVLLVLILSMLKSK